MWESTISQTGVMQGLDPLSFRSVTSQRRRLEAERTRQTSPKTRAWPVRKAFTALFKDVVYTHKPDNPRIPPPVSVYAGRYEAAIMWREDVETFAAYLTDTNNVGDLEARWFGQTPGQYPTVESLSEALTAFDVGMDGVSLALAKSYQNKVWAAVGPSHIAGIRHPDGSHQLAIVTPKGQLQPLSPEADRTQRSEPFGPPAGFSWGDDDYRGSLETARGILEYVDSTTRTPDELFDTAREFSQSAVRHWPPQFSVSVSEVRSWNRSRTLTIHRDAGPATGALRALAQPTASRRQAPTTRQTPRQPPAHAWPPTTNNTAAADMVIDPALSTTPAQRPSRPPKRRPPLERDLAR